MSKFIPYGKQCIEPDDIDAVVKTLTSDYLTTGPAVQEFEQRLCQISGAKYAVAVANGTAALHLASLAFLEEKEMVLTTPNSFIATSNSILYANATPQFVDVGENGNIDLNLCEAELKKNPEIKAIYAVHFSGNPVNQDKLKYLKETYGVKILEDCAHSIGASYLMQDGTVVNAGSCRYSDLSIFSFHPVKHVTTGEGGAITTNSKALYEKLMLLRNHGMTRDPELLTQDEMAFDQNGERNPWYYEMQVLGLNYRITDFQCALGLSQLNKLERFVNRRRDLAAAYDTAFKGSTVATPLTPDNRNSSYHLYVLQVDYDKAGLTRAEFCRKLAEKKIGVMVHYIPINKQPYYRSLGYGDESTPMMDRYYQQCISLPLFPLLSDEEQDYIIQTILHLINKKVA